jgi:hypothetical protein
MIRPFTVLCFCAFAGAGAWLYQVKHAVAMKDRELIEIRRQTEQARSRIDILRAEWALLNEPDRLRQTATRVLTLEQMQPQHFARVADFERRLPQAVAFAGAPDIFSIAPAPRQAEPAVAVATAAPATTAPPARAAQGPAQVAAAPAARVPETPAPQALAATLADQRAAAANRPVATPPAPRPAAPRPVQPAAQPASPPAVPAETRIARAAPAQTTVASALGAGTALGGSALARPMLAPPVPIAPAAAATLDSVRGGASAAR